jgi:hypothetical protein
MIRNPFQKKEDKPKPLFKSAFDEGVDTEKPVIPPPEIILDGGRYSIYIKNAETVKSAGERILAFFYALDPKAQKRSNNLGIKIAPSTTEGAPEGDISLKYGEKIIFIYVGDDKSPENAYRRIGYVMRGLEQPTLLKNYGLTVVERA